MGKVKSERKCASNVFKSRTKLKKGVRKLRAANFTERRGKGIRKKSEMDDEGEEDTIEKPGMDDYDEDKIQKSEVDNDGSDGKDNIEEFGNDDSSEDQNEIDDKDKIEDDKSAYVQHFEYELPEQASADVTPISYKKQDLTWPTIGDLVFNRPDNENVTTREPTLSKKTLEDFQLKENLFKTCQALNIFNAQDKLSKLQLEVFNIISDYFDLLFMNRTHENGEKLRFIYTLHVLNHILKARAKIIHHNSKLSKNPDEEYRDQGFTRPTSIILVPFRDDCFQIVAHLNALLEGSVVMNKKRFVNEYGSDTKPERRKPKPPDFEETFSGNINEDFKLGIRIKNKSIHLYTEFYASDLIIASPLGLRQIVGTEGEKGRDFEFLSSIEILIIDRADVLLLQNFHHLVHILQHFNLIPKESHNCNFFRVRMYALQGMAKSYRQTILLSSVEHMWFETIVFHKHCQNHSGYLCTWANVKTPAIHRILVRMKMCFRWFSSDSPIDEMDDRFNFFITHVLPDYKDQIMAQTLIYVPSYFDFVRLRNYFRQMELSCVMVCEYSKKGKIAQARDVFFKGLRHFMLYTERAHFYSRYRMKGIQHIIFYQMPTYSWFFSEMCNALVDSNPKKKFQEKSCSVLASKYDLLQLKHVVGFKQTKRMNNSKKMVFVNYVGIEV